MTNRSSEFGWNSADVVISICSKCKNYLGKGACLAFAQIPADILDGSNDHRQPYPGDNGITFEPIEDPDNGRHTNQRT